MAGETTRWTLSDHIARRSRWTLADHLARRQGLTSPAGLTIAEAVAIATDPDPAEGSLSLAHETSDNSAD